MINCGENCKFMYFYFSQQNEVFPLSKEDITVNWKELQVKLIVDHNCHLVDKINAWQWKPPKIINLTANQTLFTVSALASYCFETSATFKFLYDAVHFG